MDVSSVERGFVDCNVCSEFCAERFFGILNSFATIAVQAVIYNGVTVWFVKAVTIVTNSGESCTNSGFESVFGGGDVLIVIIVILALSESVTRLISV